MLERELSCIDWIPAFAGDDTQTGQAIAMAPRVLISDALSPAAVQIFKDRGVEVDFQPKLGADKEKLAELDRRLRRSRHPLRHQGHAEDPGEGEEASR